MIKKLTIFILLMFFAVSFVFSATKDEFVKGVRPMGMGGAFLAVSDDENAFFYNPAGITQRNSKLVQIFSLDIGINRGTLDFFGFFYDHKKDMENFQHLPVSEQINLLNKINNEALSNEPNLKFSLPNFAFISAPMKISSNSFNIGGGLFSYAKTSFKFTQSFIKPTVSFKEDFRAAALIPIAYKVNALKLSLGTNLKYTYRAEGEYLLASINDFTNLNFPIQSGAGFVGMDFGLLYNPVSSWNIGLQLSDAFNTKVNSWHDSGPLYNAEIEPQLNIGTAIKIKDTLLLAADLRDITNPDEKLFDSFWKKVHLGAELQVCSLFSLRAGANAGYPTFGFTLGSDIIQLQYSFYGEENDFYIREDQSWYHRVLFSIKTGAMNKAPKAAKVKESKKEKVKDKTPKRKKDDKSVTEDNDEYKKPLSISKETKEIINEPAQITEIKQ